MIYFKPLRRKLGVVTLLLACVFMAGWVRSLLTVDLARMACGVDSSLTLISQSQCLGVQYDQHTHPTNLRGVPYWRTRTDERTMDRVFAELNVPWNWSVGNFYVGGSRLHGEDQEYLRIGFVPYWSIVVPLAALSAWLILSKAQMTPITSKPDVQS